MYINTGYQITNTPTSIIAGHNAWQYNMPKSQWYQHTPYYYVDHTGKVQVWDKWNPPKTMHIPGGQYKGTPTRTGGFYMQNMIIDPRHIQDKEQRSCSYAGHY
jgi:hypothetical protein